MKIVVAGASGLVGGALLPTLRAGGHEVLRLVRRRATAPDEIAWNPSAGTADDPALAGADAIVNLAGENIGAGRWTARRRDAILRSRVETTRTLAGAIGRMSRPPAVLLNASAVGIYGDGGDTVLTEASKAGHGFLPEVCIAWEREAQAAAAMGVRVAPLRFGVILAENGGALTKMLPFFRLGLGGRIGSGRQWMSWIALDDAVRAIGHALEHPACLGPMNVTALQPVTNADFTATLARVLRRPAVVPVPAWALRLAVGQMADEALLSSSRAAPARLAGTGFKFKHVALEDALRTVLRREKL